MFSSFLGGSPGRSSPVGSVKWDSPTRSSATCSPTNSVVSSRSGVSTCSTVSNGVKSRHIRDLKLEVELRDARIDELEQEFDETERRAAFREGEMKGLVAQQEREVERVAKVNEDLRSELANQGGELEEVKKQIEQFKKLMEATQLIAREQERQLRIREEEAAQREAEEKARREAEEKKRQEEEEAHREEERRIEEEQKLKESAEKAARLEAEAIQAAREAAYEQKPKQSRPLPSNNGPSAKGRGSHKGPGGNKKECSIM